MGGQQPRSQAYGALRTILGLALRIQRFADSQAEEGGAELFPRLLPDFLFRVWAGWGDLPHRRLAIDFATLSVPHTAGTSAPFARSCSETRMEHVMGRRAVGSRERQLRLAVHCVEAMRSSSSEEGRVSSERSTTEVWAARRGGELCWDRGATGSGTPQRFQAWGSQQRCSWGGISATRQHSPCAIQSHPVEAVGNKGLRFPRCPCVGNVHFRVMRWDFLSFAV